MDAFTRIKLACLHTRPRKLTILRRCAWVGCGFKGLAAAAGDDGVRVIDDEPAAHEVLFVVDGDAF